VLKSPRIAAPPRHQVLDVPLSDALAPPLLHPARILIATVVAAIDRSVQCRHTQEICGCLQQEYSGIAITLIGGRTQMRDKACRNNAERLAEKSQTSQERDKSVLSSVDK